VNSSSNSAYLHDLNPFLLRIYEDFGIRWYGLAYLAGFLAGYLIILLLSRRQLTQITPKMVSDFVFTVALGAIIGGRVGYAVFYNPYLFIDFSSAVPFWGLLAIHHGGMASHGGIIGVSLACVWYGRRNNLGILHLLDLTTLGGAIGIFFGRLANFINGELPGRPAPENLPWAVKFPQDILAWPSEQPERLREISGVVKELGVREETWLEIVRSYQWDSRAWHTMESALNRIIEEIQTGNVVIAEALRPFLIARHPSQIYGAFLEGLMVFCVLLFVWKKPRKPGIIGCAFLITYSIMRIFVEQFRMPDIGIGFQLLNLTRGQWLSIAMLLFGLVSLYIVRQRSVGKIGGWGA